MAPGQGGNAETLRRYWAEGEGAAKIRWGAPGDFDRCVAEVDRFMPGRAKGYCNLLHHRALGYYPATHAKMSASHGTPNLLEASVALGIATPDALALAGGWNAMLHPRVPAGQTGGGKFTSGSGGGKKAGGGKGAKGAGKGGKGAKPSASAQAAAQAKIIAPQFLAMNPQQRAAFLAKLTNPQLAALYKAVNAGNSNDPSTKAALIAIKDQMAARSLTGAKGPTAINQAKAAAAAKSAASKQASAQKKTATAAKSAASKQASAARKQATAQATAARKQLAAAKAAATAQAKAQKASVANQAAALKAQAAMQAPTQKAQVAGLTAALKATSNPAQQQQILAQLKKALGLAQTAGVRQTLALAAGGHRQIALAGSAGHVFHYKHGWIKVDGPAPSKPRSSDVIAAKVRAAKTNHKSPLSDMKAEADKMGPHSKAAADYKTVLTALAAHAEKMGPNSKASADYKAAAAQEWPAKAAAKKTTLDGIAKSLPVKSGTNVKQPRAAAPSRVDAKPVKARPAPVSAEHKRTSLEGLSPKEVDALKLYTGEDYKGINSGLRFGSKMPAKYQDAISNIDTALAAKPLKDPAKVFRTVGGGAFGLDHGGDATALKGKVFSEAGFMSTSVTNQRFPVTPPPVHITMEVPPGVGAAYVDPISKNQGENELLLPRGMNYVITNVRKSPKGGWTATARILPSAGAK